ncbi:MAG: type II toxin-antitoxin system HicB family antitoxin [Candidatus Hydrogenedentes bacterium]|nr:type II toxin-antitoxin system HicB family antitoxin [Candidatus Hydrogenedentota bacterium]
MNETMEYKGYKAIVAFVPGDDVFHGKVINIEDTIHFEGKSVAELKRALKESVEDYLAFCKKRGEQPDKPVSGKLLLRLEPQTHRAAIYAARIAGTSINSFVAQAVTDAVRRAGL